MLEQEIPLESSNTEDSINKGVEKMEVIHVSPFDRDLLKEAITQLTDEKGQGLFSDQEIVDLAIKNDKNLNVFKVGEIDKAKSKFLNELTWLYEHPEGWERVVLTFEDEVRKRYARLGKSLPEVSGHFVEEEEIKN